MRHEKSCGAVVFSQFSGAWHVLLIRHEHGRHTSFPKGHVEAGETERQTAEREILEETGVRVRVDTGFRAENRYMARPDVEKLVVFFIAVAEEQTPVAQQGEWRGRVGRGQRGPPSALPSQIAASFRGRERYLFKEKDADVTACPALARRGDVFSPKNATKKRAYLSKAIHTKAMASPYLCPV